MGSGNPANCKGWGSSLTKFRGPFHLQEWLINLLKSNKVQNGTQIAHKGPGNFCQVSHFDRALRYRQGAECAPEEAIPSWERSSLVQCMPVGQLLDNVLINTWPRLSRAHRASWQAAYALISVSGGNCRVEGRDWAFWALTLHKSLLLWQSHRELPAETVHISYGQNALGGLCLRALTPDGSHPAASNAPAPTPTQQDPLSRWETPWSAGEQETGRHVLKK